MFEVMQTSLDSSALETMGDLNANYPLWNSHVLNLSGKKLLDLFDLNYLQISALLR
jgi:hypothetical protein